MDTHDGRASNPRPLHERPAPPGRRPKAGAFFPDATAIDAKLAMLLERHPRIRGVCCWLMGQEDPAAWKVLRKRLH